MIRPFWIIFFCAVYFLTACSRKTFNIHPDPVLIAWNEDTVNTYQLTLLENKNFVYAIIKKEGEVRRTKGFGGTYKFSADSILLTYDKSLYSVEITDYLIKETSGDYVIQYFKNSTDRMFLRIQKTNHRF